MLTEWCITVFGRMPSTSAIPWFVAPVISSRRISISRGVNWEPAGLGWSESTGGRWIPSPNVAAVDLVDA